MPTPPRPQRPAIQQVKRTTGPTGAVPCPWGCGKVQDFRPLAGEEHGGMGSGDIGFETGAVFSCDQCRRKYKIADLRKVTVVALEPIGR